MAERWTVVGIGSPLRGDDAVGLRVAERLQGRADVEVVFNHGDPFGIVDVFSAHPRVIVVDATRGAGPPGTVSVIATDDDRLPVKVGASSHGFGAVESFDLAVALGTVPERVVFVGVEAESFEGEALTPAVAAAVDEAMRAVEEVMGGA